MEAQLINMWRLYGGTMDKIIGQVRRLVPDNRGWFTEGKVYDLDNHGKVVADDGKERMPYTKGSIHWELWKWPEIIAGKGAPLQCWDDPIKQTKTKEEIDMLKIKEVTYINEKDASECDVEYYVRKINEEQSRLDKLIDVKIKSKALDKQKLQHLTNIEELIKLMDKYHG